MDIIIEHKGVKCLIDRHQFSNNVACLSLVDISDGQPFARASVNLPCYSIGKNQTFIKDVDENAGMLNSLVDNNIVKLSEFSGNEHGSVLVDIIEESLLI